MALKATFSVVLGCNWSAANKLLAAAENGDERVVGQVLREKPQLAAFAGFHGTTSPLHRAAAAGHLGVCRAILEPLKARVAAAGGGAAAAAKRPPTGAAAKWQRLLSTVLNQRSHKSLTPLMLACEHGHSQVAGYLLSEGADPLACDFVHSRTCLHYAAVGGHADCLRLLCSDSAMVPSADGARPLRDVIVTDVQVQACRFIDQRAFGGLTALHFAVVTGSLDAVQALLRAGASIMVKSDGEAYIGEDFLVPGSTPLHVAVIISNVSIVHAILQAHMEMMNILGTSLDERGRRPWEGTSRTDIRSVRNQFRKLPFHLARERQQPQLMSLVDPRIPIDVALDAARDTEHGIGPKRLGTICSLVLQRSLLQWLDECQKDLQRERVQQAHVQLAAAATAEDARLAERRTNRLQRAAQAAKQPPRPPPSPAAVPAAVADAISPPPTAAASAAAAAAAQQLGEVTPAAAAAEEQPGEAMPAAAAGLRAAPATQSPFAASAAAATAPWLSPPQQRATASAPATPAMERVTPLLAAVPAATDGAVAGLGAAAGAEGSSAGASSLDRMASLHTYMGMLSVKRPQSARSLEALLGMQAAAARPSGGRAVSRQLSGSVTPLARSSSSSGPQAPVATQSARVRFLTDPDGSAAAAGDAAAALDRAAAGSPPDSPSDAAAAALSLSANQGLLPADRIIVAPQHRRTSSQSNMRLGGVFGGLRERLRSGDSDSIPALAAAAGGGALLGEKHSEKDLALDSEPEACSPCSASEQEEEDVECGVCLDAVVEVAFAACQHKLCLECARNLTRQDKKPPHCPFCRRLVVGFQRVSTSGTVLHGPGSHGSRVTLPMGQHAARR